LLQYFDRGDILDSLQMLSNAGHRSYALLFDFFAFYDGAEVD
jgi:hypothetical protein